MRIARELTEALIRGRLLAISFAALAALVVAASLFNAYVIASHIPQNSDSVQGMLTGDSVVRGHLLLSGWHLAPDNFFFTDTLPFAVLELFFGLRANLLVVEPALTYACIVLTALSACVGPARPRAQNLTALLVIALSLGVPPRIRGGNPVLIANHHLGGVLGALVALVMCARYVRSVNRPASTEAACLVLIASGTIASDPFTIVFCFVPALLVLAGELLFKPFSARLLSAAVLMAFAIVLGIGLPEVISLSGGFVTEPFVTTKFVSVSLLGRNLHGIIFGILNISGANPFRRDMGSIEWIAAAMGCVMLALVLIALFSTARNLIMSWSAELFDGMLAASILSLLLACLVSEQFAREIGTDTSIGGAAMHYLIPAFFFGAVLAGREVPRLVAALPTYHAKRPQM